MPEPRRVQLVSSDPTHCPGYPCQRHGKVPSGAVYIGDSMWSLKRSPLHNPFRWKELGRTEAVERFRRKCLLEPAYLAFADEYVGDNDAACWCKPWEACHGDVLIELLAAYRESYDEDPEDLA